MMDALSSVSSENRARINSIVKQANSASIATKEIKCSSPDAGGDGEHNDISCAVISIINVMPVTFPVKWSDSTEDNLHRFLQCNIHAAQ